jgi:EVE domain-containing protein
MDERHYWIGVVSRDHADTAVAEGFVQLGHGKPGPLGRLQPGDGFAFYSPRESHPAGAPLQAFTAIGRVADGPVYASAVAEAGPTFRRNATYFDATPAPIKPLLERLSFIRSKVHWGAALRFGLVRVSRADFAVIAFAMGRDLDADLAE